MVVNTPKYMTRCVQKTGADEDAPAGGWFNEQPESGATDEHIASWFKQQSNASDAEIAEWFRAKSHNHNEKQQVEVEKQLGSTDAEVVDCSHNAWF